MLFNSPRPVCFPDLTRCLTVLLLILDGTCASAQESTLTPGTSFVSTTPSLYLRVCYAYLFCEVVGI